MLNHEKLIGDCPHSSAKLAFVFEFDFDQGTGGNQNYQLLYGRPRWVVLS